MFERQIIFEKLGKEKQKLIEESEVCIVGLGALGTSSAELLARSGVKKLILIDDDIIEEHNIQRQCLFNKNDIGKSKSETAEKKLIEINKINIKIFIERLTKENIDLLKSDLILDCTDNLETRFLINEYSIKNNVPWIYSSALESEGYVLSIYPKKTPCFSCIIKNHDETLGDCETYGVLNTIIRTVSSFQVTEALKILTGQNFTKELIHINIWNSRLTKIKIKKKPGCICSGKLFSEDSGISVKKCSSSGAFIARPSGKQFLDLKKIRNIFNLVADTPVVVIIRDKFKVSCYKNGKLMIECSNMKDAEDQAEKIYSLAGSSTFTSK